MALSMAVERVLSDEVARMTGLATRTVLAMSARGQIPSAAKLGLRWSYDPIQVAKWITSLENAAMRPRPAIKATRIDLVRSAGDAKDDPFEAAIRAKLAGIDKLP